MKPNIGRDGNIGDHQPSHRRSIWRALVRSPRRTLFVAVAMTLIATIAAPAGAGSVASIGETTDAVTVWNANAGEAAIAACISPDGNPLHESRMYAMTHVAIHDALNAIDRRSAPYVFDGTAEPARVSGRRRGGRRAGRRWSRSSVSSRIPVPAGVHRRRHRERGSGLRGRARRDPGRAGQDAGRRGRERRRPPPSSRSGRRRFGHAPAGLRLPAGHRARRVSLHARHPVRVRTGVGGRHPVRAARQLTVPREPAVRRDHARSTRRTSTR